ncbi:hypothetical protein AC249_AIPGENE2672 [Exaiptasia diaphana]|nr:hypothetical protein AC249_AIPGENE2672 [Exaiptasia diaphana]
MSEKRTVPNCQLEPEEKLIKRGQWVPVRNISVLMSQPADPAAKIQRWAKPITFNEKVQKGIHDLPYAGPVTTNKALHRGVNEH